MMGEHSRRLPGLTVLRGLAIGLVLLCHAFPVFDGGGIVGVVLFFTLSGYLITGILVREIKRSDRVSFRRFYRNRFLRLGPALLVVLAVFVVVESTSHRLGKGGNVPGTVFLAITYLADLPIGPHISIGMSHLWTLAVEEQFYLAWPTLLVLAIRWRRLHAMVLVTAVGTLTVCAISLLLLQPAIFMAYTLPTSWGITLIAGAAAFVHRDRLSPSFVGPRGAAYASVALAVLVTVSFVHDAKDHWWTYIVGAPLVAAATIALILYVSQWRTLQPWPLRWLERLGVISYAAYLWNYLIVSWIRGDQLVDLEPAQGVLSVALTVAAASLSWAFVESPALRFKARLQRRDLARDAVPVP